MKDTILSHKHIETEHSTSLSLLFRLRLLQSSYLEKGHLHRRARAHERLWRGIIKSWRLVSARWRELWRGNIASASPPWRPR